MTKYSLLSEYTDIIKENPKNKNKVKYQEYIIEVDNVECSVYIPIRLSEDFEEVINNTEYLDEGKIRTLMREYRGIRNREK